MPRSMSADFVLPNGANELPSTTESSDEQNPDPECTEGTARSRAGVQRKTTSARIVKPVRPKAINGRANTRKTKTENFIDILG